MAALTPTQALTPSATITTVSGATSPTAGSTETSSTPGLNLPPISSALPPSLASHLATVRSEAAKHHVEVKRPRVQQFATPASDLATPVNTRDKNGSLRVVTARGDLTGQEELAWIAGGVTAHGNVDCSQTFQFMSNKPAAKRDNMLVCWRTSAERSVVTVMVDMDGNPSLKKSLATVHDHWKKMG
ncbi:hypothetical protein FB565_002453 [Actinoplanes lutulentus]|uniref:hypothetical protein n=1 Tax=Actinoplanes lutulentus TaxID=1287878 RepID=UPI0011B949FD|nr:hypothetical protein [Actinoplanes lutulentus]MBB2942740.1 hypothetical protein [Actinoplanes lutulentus]